MLDTCVAGTSTRLCPLVVFFSQKTAAVWGKTQERKYLWGVRNMAMGTRVVFERGTCKILRVGKKSIRLFRPRDAYAPPEDWQSRAARACSQPSAPPGSSAGVRMRADLRGGWATRASRVQGWRAHARRRARRLGHERHLGREAGRSGSCRVAFESWSIPGCDLGRAVSILRALGSSSVEWGERCLRGVSGRGHGARRRPQHVGSGPTLRTSF